MIGYATDLASTLFFLHDHPCHWMGWPPLNTWS